MMAGTTALQLNLAIDLLQRRRKKLKFLAHCSGVAYRAEARQDLAQTENCLAALVNKLKRNG